MSRSPRRKTIFATTGGKHNVSLDQLPIAVAKEVAQTKRAEMRNRHERQRKAISDELTRIEASIRSNAFTSDIRMRLSNIRTQLKRSKGTKKKKKSVRFAEGVKKTSRVMR